MDRIKPSPSPEKIREILSEHHKGGITDDYCLVCSSACCNEGGFAILENVLLIYEHYKRGLLKRKDFKYESGLSFIDFVKKYFDVSVITSGSWFWKKSIMLLYMKNISSDNCLISMPNFGRYYETRR